MALLGSVIIVVTVGAGAADVTASAEITTEGTAAVEITAAVAMGALAM